jgi:hypothetical protein
MSALSLQRRPSNETLLFIRAECSSTQLLALYANIGIVSVRYLNPYIFGARSH